MSLLDPEALAKALVKYKFFSKKTKAVDEDGKPVLTKPFDILQDQQKDIYDDVVKDIRSGHFGGVIESPTGSGKTVAFGTLLKACDPVLKDARKFSDVKGSLIVVPTRELLKQTYAELTGPLVGIDRHDIDIYDAELEYFKWFGNSDHAYEYNDDHEGDLLQAYEGEKISDNRSFADGFETDGPEPPEILNTARHLIMTYAAFNRLTQRGFLHPEHRPFLILDEIDHAKGPITQSNIHAYTKALPPAFVLGFTATDRFLDSNGTIQSTNDIFFGRNEPIYRKTIEQAIENKEILQPNAIEIPLDYTSNYQSDALKDFSTQGLNQLVNQKERTPNAIKHLVRQFGETAFRDKSQIWFCATNAHARDTVKALNQRFGEGFAALAVGDRNNQSPYGMSATERSQNIDAFNSGKTKVLVTAKLLERGNNFPHASLCVMLAPTRSPTRSLQAGGRVLRIDPNNPNKKAYIVDFLDPGVENTATYKKVLDGTFFEEYARKGAISKAALTPDLAAIYNTAPPPEPRARSANGRWKQKIQPTASGAANHADTNDTTSNVSPSQSATKGDTIKSELIDPGAKILLPNSFPDPDFFVYLDYLARHILPNASETGRASDQAEVLFETLGLANTQFPKNIFMKIAVDGESPQQPVETLKEAITDFLEKNLYPTTTHYVPAVFHIAPPSPPKDNATIDETSLLQQKLELYERYRDKRSKATFPDYSKEPTDLKAAAQKLGNALDGNITLPQGCSVELYPDQRISIKAFQQALEEGHQDSRLVAPPRSGKTYIFGYSLLALAAKKDNGELSFDGYSLYTAPSTRIAKQTRDTLINDFKIPEKDIGYIDGNTPNYQLKNELDKPIQVMTRDSAVNLFRTDEQTERSKLNQRKISDYQLFFPDELQNHTGSAGMGLYNAFKQAGAIILGLTGSDILMLIRNNFNEVTDKVTLGDVLQQGRPPIRDIAPSEADIAPTLEYVLKLKAGKKETRRTTGELDIAEQNTIHSENANKIIHAFSHANDPRLPYRPCDEQSIWFVPRSPEGAESGVNAMDLVKKLNEAFYPGYADCIYDGKGDDENQKVIERFNNGEFKAIVNVNMLSEGITLPNAYTVWETCPTNSPRKKIQSGLRASTPVTDKPNKIAACYTLSIPGVPGTSLTELYGKDIMHALEEKASQHFIDPKERPSPGTRQRPAEPKHPRPEPGKPDSAPTTPDNESSPIGDTYEFISGSHNIAGYYRLQNVVEAAGRKPSNFLTKEEYINYVTDNGKISIPYTSLDTVFKRIRLFVGREHLELNEAEHSEVQDANENILNVLGHTVTTADAGFYVDENSKVRLPQLCVRQDVADAHKAFYAARANRTLPSTENPSENYLSVTQMHELLQSKSTKKIGYDALQNYYKNIERLFGEPPGETDDIYHYESVLPRESARYNEHGNRFLISDSCADEILSFFNIPEKTDERWGVDDIARAIPVANERAGKLMAGLTDLYKLRVDPVTYNGVSIPRSALHYCRGGTSVPLTIAAEDYRGSIEKMLGLQPKLTDQQIARQDAKHYTDVPNRFFRPFDVIQRLHEAFVILQEEGIDITNPDSIDVDTIITSFEEQHTAHIPQPIDAFSNTSEAKEMNAIRKRGDAIKNAIQLYQGAASKGVSFDLEHNSMCILGIQFTTSEMGYFRPTKGKAVFALDKTNHITAFNSLMDGRENTPELGVQFRDLEKTIKPAKSRA